MLNFNRTNLFLKAFDIARMRVLFMHQKLISTPVGDIMYEIFNILDKVTKTIFENSINSDYSVRLCLEAALIYTYYKALKRSEDMIKKINENYSFKWEFSGEYGKRTKHQTFEVPQLVIRVESKLTDDSESDITSLHDIPEIVKFEDDNILDVPLINETSSNEKTRHLSNMEKCFFLVQCMRIDETRIGNIFSNEEINSIINVIIYMLQSVYVYLTR